jgi:hypothetical protein
VIAAAVVRLDGLTSRWCVCVALVSLLILEHFRRQEGVTHEPSRSPTSRGMTAGPGP